MQELQINWANVCVCVGMEGVFLTCIGSGRPVSRWEDYRRKHTWQRILPKWSMTEGYVWQLIPIIQSFFYTGNFLQKSAECRVQWRRNLRKSWNRPEILILHKLSGKVLSPWKLTTEDKSQTLIDLESRDFKILHPHTSPPRILENCQNWQISHKIDAVYFEEHGITQNEGWACLKLILNENFGRHPKPRDLAILYSGQGFDYFVEWVGIWLFCRGRVDIWKPSLLLLKSWAKARFIFSERNRAAWNF